MKKDEILPHFKFLGYSDLDILDFGAGFAQKTLGRDVREEWGGCFHVVSFQVIEKKLVNRGIITWLLAEGAKFLFASTGDEDTEAIFPSECKEVADEIDSVLMWFRDYTYNPFF